MQKINCNPLDIIHKVDEKEGAVSSEWKHQVLSLWKSIFPALIGKARIEAIRAKTVIIGVYDPRYMMIVQTSSLDFKVKIIQSIPDVPLDITLQVVWAKQRPSFLVVASQQVRSSFEARQAKSINGEEYGQISLLGSDFLLSSAQKNAYNQIQDQQLKDQLLLYWKRCKTLGAQ